MKYLIQILQLLIYIITLILSFIVYGKQQNTNLELSNKVSNLEYELQQTEDRCERMTDTCIDILANGRWN